MNELDARNEWQLSLPWIRRFYKLYIMFRIANPRRLPYPTMLSPSLEFTMDQDETMSYNPLLSTDDLGPSVFTCEIRNVFLHSEAKS